MAWGDVRSGSIASVWCSAGYFRPTPINGHRETGRVGPFRANHITESGRMIVPAPLEGLMPVD
jgi:hypothetical protein